MKKLNKILIVGFLIVLMLLFGCAKEVSNDEIEQQLSGLSDAELLDVATAEENTALIGQAIQTPVVKGVPISRAKSVAQAMIVNKLKEGTLVMAGSENGLMPIQENQFDTGDFFVRVRNYQGSLNSQSMLEAINNLRTQGENGDSSDGGLSGDPTISAVTCNEPYYCCVWDCPTCIYDDTSLCDPCDCGQCCQS